MNNFDFLSVKSYQYLSNQLNQSIGNKMVLIAGRCSAYFDGRIKSTLEEGDRLLIIKKDLSILMHGPSGVKPLNWQKPEAGPISFSKNENNQLEMFTRRKKTKEVLTIIFSHVEFAANWNARDESSLQIIGDESDLVKYLVSNPDVIAEGFQVVNTEYNTEVGPVDIKGILAGENVIVEVKKRKATPADAHQLKRYIEYFKAKEEIETRGILVASDFPESVVKYLNDNDLKAKVIHWKDIFPVLKRPKKPKLDEFIK